VRLTTISLGALWLACTAFPVAAAGGWTPLFNGKNLDGWDSIGSGIWTVLRDGTVLGQRDLTEKLEHQAWLYTKKHYRQFDLECDYWTRYGGNSGISLRDHTRGKWSIDTPEWDPKRTPSHQGYEVQILNLPGAKGYITGSIYNFREARPGFERFNDWNHLRIELRDDRIRVLLNGTEVAVTATDPKRPLDGPIGLQLHDRQALVMFRNLRIHEVK
jgi:hypothetical protein